MNLDALVLDHLNTSQKRYEQLKDELTFLGRNDLANVYKRMAKMAIQLQSEIYDSMGGK